jgi:hypothetical protein
VLAAHRADHNVLVAGCRRQQRIGFLQNRNFNMITGGRRR